MTLCEGSWLKSRITLLITEAILLVALVFIVLHEGNTSISIPIYGTVNEQLVDAITAAHSGGFTKVISYTVAGSRGYGGTVFYRITAPWWMVNSVADHLRAEPFVLEGF